jgi:hypothetical protein
MEALLRGVPLEMASSLVLKPSAKAAWDLLELARLGSYRAHVLGAARGKVVCEHLLPQWQVTRRVCALPWQDGA